MSPLAYLIYIPGRKTIPLIVYSLPLPFPPHLTLFRNLKHKGSDPVLTFTGFTLVKHS